MNHRTHTVSLTGKLTDANHERRPAPKWACTVNDRPIPLPRRIVEVALIRAQAELRATSILVRDHDSPNDVILREDEPVDLAKGNVFYTLDCPDPKNRGACDAPAKLAFFVDDRAEETLNPHQTGETIRDLFGLSKDINLIRDFESPHDQVVQPNDEAPFEKGPVFVTRHHDVKLTITVNHKRFTECDGVKRFMTGRQIAALVSDTPDRTEVFRLGGSQGQCPVMGMSFSERNKNLFAGHLRRDFLSSRA